MLSAHTIKNPLPVGVFGERSVVMRLLTRRQRGSGMAVRGRSGEPALKAATTRDRSQTNLLERYEIRTLLSKASMSRILITVVPVATPVNNEGAEPAMPFGCN